MPARCPGPVGSFGVDLWQLIIHFCFEHCHHLFQYNVFWDSASVFDQASNTFTFSPNQYGKLRQVSRGMYHAICDLWKDKYGLRIVAGMILARKQLAVDARTIGRITLEYLKAQKYSASIYDMSALKLFMVDGSVSKYLESDEQAEDFWARLNTQMVYNAIALLFDQSTLYDTPYCIQLSNHFGELLIHGFFRASDGSYVSGGIRNTDASVELIFCVLKRILWRGRGNFLSTWTWPESLPLLFEYEPHVRQWQQMKGFSTLYCLMRKNTDESTWKPLSQCIYYAASETEALFVNPYEFGELLTDLMDNMAPIWQPNTRYNQAIPMLLSLTRLLATLHLQHPLLHPPASLNLATLVESPCCLQSMEPSAIDQALRPLWLDADAFVQDDTGYLYRASDDLDDLLDNDASLCTLDPAFYNILYTGDCVTTPELYLQVFNSFVLWLFSRYSASQLGKHEAKIRYRMQVWECDGEDGEDDPPYIAELKQKIKIK